MLNFDDIDILINGSAILSESAVINSDNSVQAFRYVGVDTPSIFPAGSIRNSVQLTYNLKPEVDPVIPLINLIKNNVYVPVQIEIAGLITTGYLDSFNVRVTPNQPVKANVSFVSFNPLGGIYSEKSYTIAQDQTPDGVSHGWTTYISSSGNYLTIPTYEFSYDFIATWQPIYTLGKKFPSQVQLVGGEERVNLVRDEFYEVSFSGIDHGRKLLGSNSERQIQLTAITFLWNDNIQSALNLNLSSAKINTSTLEARPDDIVKVRVGIINSF